MVTNINKYNLGEYLDYFKGREDYIACQGNTHYYPIKSALNEDLLLKHIDGIQTLGVYVLTKVSKCNFICIDIDIPKSKLSEVDFKDPKIKFESLKIHLFKVINDLTTGLSFSVNNLLLEDTGGRGYHVWIFFEEPIDGSIITQVNEILKVKYDFEFEFFPKQSSLNEERKYGNLIKLPLGLHKKYQQRSNFFTIEGEQIIVFDSVHSNLLYLHKIKKVNQSTIEKILEINGDVLVKATRFEKEDFDIKERVLYKNNLKRLFTNCIALNQLSEKAKKGIKLSHLEAFHLSNTLLSVEDSRVDLDRLLKLSYAEDYDVEIANREISNIEQFRPSSCKTLIQCGICPKYCKREVEARNEDPLLKRTNPLSVWLDPLYIGNTNQRREDILHQICDLENIKTAYSRLKHYHGKEAAVFFDEFDFEFFEKDFDENINLISIALKNKLSLPSSRYTIVNIPKKLDEDRNIIYRQMTYSSVFDQIIVQSIFNVIAIFLEEKFHQNSYGYRLNIIDNKSNKIFEDWKEKYPQFRNSILNKLREPHIKFYLCCDIKSYYDSIRKEDLILQLRGIIDDDYIFGILKSTINSYSFNGYQELGLPQGPAYARALANLYLNDFDKEVALKSNYYFRYVDDLFILFESKEKAEETLEWITKKLAVLGLSLSTDIDKEAIIKEADDEKIIIEKMDSFRYGVFEEAKFLPYLEKKQIKEFYETASQKILPENDSTKINAALPSLISVYSKETNEDLESQIALVEIVEQLSKNKNFFPKKYATFFNRILDLFIKASKNYLSFYKSLEDAHKVFFLLSVYQKFKEEVDISNQSLKFGQSLKDILSENLKSDDTFLKGFTVAICEKHKETLSVFIEKSEIIDHVILRNDEFVAKKIFSTMDYFSQNNETKSKISLYLKPSTNYLLKKHFLDGLKDFTKYNEIDTLLFTNILQTNHFLLHTQCCKIISQFSSKNSLFEKLISFITDQKLIYKSFLIDTLGRYIFLRYQNLSSLEIENLKILYKSDVDEEIVLRVSEIIARINNVFITKKPSPIDDCNKISSYDECHYYQSNNNLDLFIEIIPDRKLKYATTEEYQDFKKIVSSLADYQVLPNNETDYKSYDQSVVIRYFHKQEYKSILSGSFSWQNQQDCYNALLLINNINKKANRYYKEFNRFPIIESNNLKIINDKFDIVFTNFGLSLCDSYFIKNFYLDNSNPNDIGKNIYLFIFDLLFADKKEWDKFEKESKINISIFLWYILKRLKSNTISVQRLDYLINEINRIGFDSTIDICHFYFSERLRISLFEHNLNQISWKGITKSVLDIYESFAITYDKIKFEQTLYYNKVAFNFSSPKKIHYLGKELINLNLNIENLIPSLFEKYSVKVFKLLNLFSVLCIEYQSLVKAILWEKKPLSYIKPDSLNVIFDTVTIDVFFNEVSNINKLIKIFNSTENNIFDESVHYSLKELSFLCALKMTDQKTIDNKLEFIKPDRLQEQDFDLLLNTFLLKIPRIEHLMISLVIEINFSLSKNFQFNDSGIVNLKSIEDEIFEVLADLSNIKKCNKIRRHTVRKFLVNKFGTKIIFKRFLKKQKQVSVQLSKGIPLSNLSPAHTSKFSYDIYKKKIINTVIPNERILVLLKKLKRGKKMGFRLSYLYHEKSMLFFDILGLLLFFAIETYMTLNYDHKTTDPLLSDNLFYMISHSSLWVIRQTFVAPLVFFVAKIFLHDLSFWFSGYPKFLNMLKFKK